MNNPALNPAGNTSTSTNTPSISDTTSSSTTTTTNSSDVDQETLRRRTTTTQSNNNTDNTDSVSTTWTPAATPVPGPPSRVEHISFIMTCVVAFLLVVLILRRLAMENLSPGKQ